MTLLHAAAEVVLAIDQGTTNTKCVAVNRDGAVVCIAAAPLAMLSPRDQWMEQSPADILASVSTTLQEAAKECTDRGFRIAGIAISNQRETALAWDAATGDVIGNAISWQCRRSTGVCDRIASHALEIHERTGLVLDPLVSASKWAWLLTESALATRAKDLMASGDLRFGNVDAWLLWWLTGGKVHATDHTNASRTALFGLTSLAWDSEMAGLFGIDISALPEVKTSASHFGVCNAIGSLQGVPIVSMVGDSHAALAAQGPSGTVKATYGTGSSLMVALDELPRDSKGLARAIGYSTTSGVQYALEGNIAMSGAALKWVGDFLGLADPVADTAALAASVPDSDGVVFVPAMAGLGAPWWDASARGALLNLGPWHTKAHMARAALESITHQVTDVFEAMVEATGVVLPALSADGGATRNDSLMQFQADMLQCEVRRSQREELSAIGAAWLGGVTLGWWKSVDEPYRMAAPPQLFSPLMPNDLRVTRRQVWLESVRRTLSQGAA
ncbi:glycerol kinase [Bryocella elongata]|uniref:Glycerol kinase n=1 Tax=Bryocella elongata TaxID=863522 RepID=A0A1H6AXW4_9BACT|nr:FGGY family carbohydrate kinase [Bryocella elongata]SEG53194.1 glycerol kinase [Bryocella elongata]